MGSLSDDNIASCCASANSAGFGMRIVILILDFID